MKVSIAEPFSITQPWRIGGAGGNQRQFHGLIDEARVYDTPLAPPQIAALANPHSLDEIARAARRTASDNDELRWAFLDGASIEIGEVGRVWKKASALRLQKARVETAAPSVMVMQEMDKLRPTFVLKRGSYDLCFIKSMHTGQINHDPAITFMTTGFQLAGRPSIGSWVSYGLGSENQNLPAFIAMVSVGTGNTNDQPLYDRLWGSGFLPSKYQGVKLRAGAEAVLYLSDPPGISPRMRRRFLDDLAELNHVRQQDYADPEISTRIAQYEMAFRMQSSVPELTDLSKEPESTFIRYGPDSRKPGSYAANCVLARRLAERGVRFIYNITRDPVDVHDLNAVFI